MLAIPDGRKRKHDMYSIMRGGWMIETLSLNSLFDGIWYQKRKQRCAAHHRVSNYVARSILIRSRLCCIECGKVQSKSLNN